MNLLREYGFKDTKDYAPYTPARVTAEHRERYELIGEAGAFYGRLKSGVYFGEENERFPTVGDFVLVEYNPAGDSRIVRTLERRSIFERRDPSYARPRAQAVAANFDYVFIVQSLNRDFNVKKLARYLTLAHQSGAETVIVLTKLDLHELDSEKAIAEAEHASFGAPVFAVSSKTGENLEHIRGFLQPGVTVALLGSSGAGKSSLVNALAGETVMETGVIRESDGRGRHTTTHRALLRLPCGALVIDTPGMRELGMWDVSEGLGEAFEDIRALEAQCRFSDCAHEHEPGCAVRAAIERGALSEERLRQYKSLKDEAKFGLDLAKRCKGRKKGGKLREKGR